MISTIFILGTILFFLVSGLLRTRSKLTARQFFFMDHQATLSNYVDTTVAFSLQVAVTIYFIFWGYKYGWSNILFVLTWCLGIYIFSLAAPKFSAMLLAHETLLSYIALESRSVRLVSAIVIVLSLFGLMYTELFLTTKFIATAIAHTSSEISYENWYWITFFMLLVSVGLYVSVGGAQKVVSTDKQQLVLAYLASTVFFMAIHWDVAKNGARVYYWTYIPILFAYVALWLGCGLSAYISDGTTNRRFRFFPREFSLASTYTPFFCAILLTVLIVAPPKFGGSDVIDFPKSVFSMIDEESGYGVWALFGFAIANIIWQFSDYTAYHRLGLLKLDDDDAVARVGAIKRSILGTMLSSPVTWALGVFAGMAIHASGLIPDSAADQNIFFDFVAALVRSSSGGDQSSYVALTALGMFITAVMLSTVDSAFISAGK